MFGTIGHVHPKPGSEPRLEALMTDWKKTIRPQIPGHFLEVSGMSKDRPGEFVFLALAQDEATYRALASNPDQHAWYERMMECVEGDITWEDVEMEITLND